MSGLDEMTPDERARVEAQRPVRMRRFSDGRIVPAGRDRVAERLASGLYEIVEQPGE